MEQIEALVASVARGQGRALLLEGEAGIGKSRLLEEALTVAAGLGLPVHRARAEELDSRRPFGAIATCLGFTPRPTQARRAEIARLLFGDIPEGTDTFLAAGGSATEFRLVEAMVMRVEEMCAEGPVAVAIDDLQWADPATLDVLHQLGRLVDDYPLLLCGAFRPAPRPPELTRLLRGLTAQKATMLAIPPLDPAGVFTLLSSVLGVDPGTRLVRQAAATGGNPFYVTELVGALRASGSMRETATSAEIDSVALPSALKLTVLLELSFLSESTQELLRTAAVLGSGWTVHDLGLVSGRSPIALAPPLREAMAARVIQEEGDRMAFRHDLLREALYDDIPRSLRLGMHLHIAQTLAAAGASPLAVAEHFVRGAQKGDGNALEWLRRAADEAMVRAPATAAQLLERALDLLEPGDPARDALLADYVLCLEGVGRGEEGEVIVLDLLNRRQPPRTEARLRVLLCRRLTVRGESEEAFRIAAEAQDIDGLTPGQQARILSFRSQLALFPPRRGLAEELATEARRRGEELGDGITQAIGAYTLAMAAFQRGRFVEMRQWAEKAFVLQEDDPEARMGVGWRHQNQTGRIALCQAHLRLDQFDEAGATLQAALQAIREHGFRGLQASGQCLVVQQRYETGDWDDAVTEFEALTDASALLGQQWGIDLAAGARALISLHRGDRDGAATALRLATSSPTRGAYDRHLATLAEALLAETGGAPAEALAVLVDRWDGAVARGVRSLCVALAPDLVRLARRAGDFDRALDACREVEAIVAVNPGVATIAGVGLRCRGLVDDDAGLLAAAAALMRDTPRTLERALAFEDAADALARTGDTAAARQLFDEAIQAYERLDAAWDIARARARMRAVGVRQGSRDTRKRPTTGWEALTRGERTVVELVAEGLSNPEVAERLFLSRHTVKRHLSNAMTKLGMASRVELIRLPARQDA
jgi:DNA-binding CsgD family transcriptional regulator/tetratricopeptide (TPR) repeat protein